jgi:predicted RNase H-like HicB family nuclease
LTHPHSYAVVVFWSEEDGAWVADAPDLRSCSAYDGTPEEAVAELRIAVDAWLETAQARGLPLPQARFRK